MSKKARLRKKLCRKLSKEWRNANLDEILRKDFETFLMFGEWSSQPQSVAELIAQNASLVRSSIVPWTSILENFASTKKLHHNVLNSIFTRNETDSNRKQFVRK